ncbi:hypothetical protein AB0K00_33755 [Dactylosporangium sp. NPDC049525]|uniref:hypothetical protein n=1 Tax=Dactylosporangium sp. NPDC049525 TaxID=3154730 RepID=UPI003423CFFB
MLLRALDVSNVLGTTVLITWLPAVVVGGITGESSPWPSVLMLVLGPVYLVVMAGLYRQNEAPVTSRLLARVRHEMPTGNHEYVLYLRSFLVDRVLAGQDPVGGANFMTTLASYFGIRHPRRLENPWESRITDLLGRLGPVVAVGRPGEPLPPLGAKRVYLRPPAGRTWKDEVSEAIRSARLVAIVAAVSEDPGTAEGTLWEYTEALRLLPPEQVVLVACGGREAYERFRVRAAEYHRKRAGALPPLPVLPDWPEPRRPGKARAGFPFHGVVRFRTGWAAEFVHFDTTTVRGPTPFARWRKAERTSVEPWLEDCEQRLPGTAVRPMKIRLHWNLKVLLALPFVVLGSVLALRSDDMSAATVATGCVAFIYMALTVVRIAATIRDAGRSDVRVRLPADVSDVGVDSSVASYLVVGFTLRWPGRSGLGLADFAFYRDMDRREVDAPRGPFWRVKTLQRPVPFLDDPEQVAVHSVQGRQVFVVHPVRLAVVAERDAAVTSDQFIQRVMNRTAGTVGVVVGYPVAIIFQAHTLGIRLALGALGVLSLVSMRAGRRRTLRRLGQIRWRPRIPADLYRDPCVLYLRPHTDDPDLDLDLNEILSSVGLFRVGYRQDTPPPRRNLGWLPLPEDGRLLTTALPNCKLVVVLTTGTDPATLQQVTEAVRQLEPSRLLLFIPSATSDEEYTRFRDATADAFAERGAALPGNLPPQAPPGAEPPIRGVIHFTDDWSPTVVSLVPQSTDVPRGAQLLSIQAKLRPILAGLPAETPVHLPEPRTADDDRPVGADQSGAAVPSSPLAHDA